MWQGFIETIHYYLVAKVRLMSFRPLRFTQGKLREKSSLVSSKISQSLRSFEMTRLFMQLSTSPMPGWISPNSFQRYFNLNTPGAVALTVVLAAEAFIVQPLDLLYIRHRQNRSVVFNLQDIPAVEATGLHASKPAGWTRRIFFGRNALIIVYADLGLPGFKAKSIVSHCGTTPSASPFCLAGTPSPAPQLCLR
jgi:hypothetical protein